jgi:radical SAM protein with 4Fe4S-binding SPASM domain
MTPDTLSNILTPENLSGSYFVELQMSGEPLLHSHFHTTVSEIRRAFPDICLGLSTNGSLIHECIGALVKLDYITISVDSITGYENVRKNNNGFDSESLIENIDLLVRSVNPNKTKIDLQLIELPGYEVQLNLVKNIFHDYPVRIRTVPDCFVTLFKEVEEPVKTDMCLNPWLSVSIQSNGNVVPCCFAFGDDIVYGNINEHSLKEIWNGTKVKELREQHVTRNYGRLCRTCYMRSPVLLHWDLYLKSIRKHFA